MTIAEESGEKQPTSTLNYLSYVVIDEDGTVKVNGDPRLSCKLEPGHIRFDNVYNVVRQICESNGKDWLNDETITREVKAAIKNRFWKIAGSYKQQTTKTEPQIQIELTAELTREITFAEVGAKLSTSIKRDDGAKLITFCGFLLAQTNEDQLNLGYQSESSAGKSYIPIEIATYFPKEEVEILASASPTAFYHDGQWDNEKKILFRNLECKNLIFLDQPHFQLLEKLRPLLSKDMKELHYKITDKNQKMGLRTKNVIIRGYPSVFFCTTKTDPDEQEKTRMILLSPSTDQIKLQESLELAALRKSNPEEYRKRILQDPQRLWLANRIKAIRQWGIREIVVPDEGKGVYKRFRKEHPHLLPRHQRDFPRIFSFIKAHALLNCFNREKVMNGDPEKPAAIIANQADIDAGFTLYKEIEQSNQLGLSPFIYRIYEEVIQPNLSQEKGLSRKELRTSYFSIMRKTLSSKLEESVITQLEGAGLITQEEDENDRRKMLIYPTILGNVVSDKIDEKCIPHDRGEPQLETFIQVNQGLETATQGVFFCEYGCKAFATEKQLINHVQEVHKEAHS